MKTLAVFLLLTGISHAQGILGKNAPELRVDSWVSLPENTPKPPTIAGLKGKAVYLYCFQSWCPGCHSSGFPTLQAMIKQYGDDKDVAILTVQTVFEGFSTNTEKAARDIVKKYQLQSIPVAQSGTRDSGRSKLMADFRTGGTPWTVIIAPDGKVAFNGFHISPAKARSLIDKLKR